ncbi:hypothetical protein [Flavobacterium sp.]|uniref:hypothetical protein n=1 Tax=Flavobacterium sp. TaxID=239 RepID=UPI0040341B1C
MRTNDIVLRLMSRDIPQLKIGKPENYANFYRSLKEAISLRMADLVYKGDYFRYDHHLLPRHDDGFSTYVLFREITPDEDDDGSLWRILESEASRLDLPEIRESDGHHQLIELSSLPSINSDTLYNNEQEWEDILVRIGGTRAELEFDPTGAEGNAILYDRLAKLVYDKEAEIMYKGPRLILDENRDLFFNDDEFSIYVLFRSQRSSVYEDRELVWANLASDLKEPSTITLLRSADNYQVVLLSHDEIRNNNPDI